MKKIFSATLVLVFFFIMPTFAQNAETMKRDAFSNLDARYADYKNIALQIWDNAEVGFKEYKSSALLQKTLSDAGFAVQAGVADMPTAFVGTFGSGKPVIGILAEYDALPGLSQVAEPDKKIRDGKTSAGHGCGHHLFGTASVAAAIELKNQLLKNNLKGTIKLYGCPAEEGGSGKVYLVRAGLFNGVDVVLHWHPSSKNGANPNSSLANISAKFRFHGLSAHAAAAPERGRSALDGVESMDYMVNMMREHIPSDTRIHYVITDGGKAPNVVPDFSEVYYYVRHPKPKMVQDIFERVVKCAKGAAMGTETTVDYEIIGGTYNLLPNVTLSKVMYDNLVKVGGVQYTEAEKDFGKKIGATFVNMPIDYTDNEKIEPFVDRSKMDGTGGSTDVSDISWVVPTVGLSTATWSPGVPAHSWQAVACGGTEIGTKGMINAAKTLAATGLDLFTSPQTIETATAEFKKSRGDSFTYKSLLGDRKPALNYRDGSVNE